jgi:hypothetical protein
MKKGGDSMELRDYLFEKEVLVADKSFKSLKEYNEEDVLKQIALARNLHNIFMGYSIYGSTRINSTIGKLIESIKVDLKKCKVNLNEVNNKSEKNKMDEFLINNGELILKKVEDTLLFLKEVDYCGIIKRSMKKNEICLGKIDEGNLRVFKEIEISSLKDISYNLVEEDIYHYLRKVRRRNPNSKLFKYINKYVEDAFLGDNSRQYIKILLLVPYDTIRNWRKYSINKKGLSSEDYVNIITKSMKYEMDV